MRRAGIALAMVLAGCGVEPPPAEPPHEQTARIDVTSLEVEVLPDADTGLDICGLAASLPGDDVCSLVCDPDAFAARLVDRGMETGNCYQFRCALTDEVSVSIGLCLL